MAPSPATKLPLLLKAWDAYVDQWGFGGDGQAVRQVKADMREALDHFNQLRKKLKCKSIKDAAIGLLDVTQANFEETFDSVYELGTGRNRASAIAFPALGIEMRAALAEFGDEIGCPDFKKELGLLP